MYGVPFVGSPWMGGSPASMRPRAGSRMNARFGVLTNILPVVGLYDVYRFPPEGIASDPVARSTFRVGEPVALVT